MVFVDEAVEVVLTWLWKQSVLHKADIDIVPKLAAGIKIVCLHNAFKGYTTKTTSKVDIHWRV